MNHNSDRGPWESTPGLTARMVELHAMTGEQYLSASDIARMLSREFNVTLTRNSVIGRSHRMNLPVRGGPPGRKRKQTEARPKMVKIRSHVDAPIPPVMAEPPGPQAGLTIYQTGYGDCRWILEPPEAYPPYTYCGAETAEGRSYCPDHYRVTHFRARAITE